MAKGILREGSETTDLRTKKEKQISKKIFLEKKFRVDLFCETFQVSLEKFFKSSKTSFDEIFPSTWKEVSREEKKLLTKIRQTYKIILIRKGYFGTQTDYMKNTHYQIVELFGTNSIAEKLFLRDMRKYFTA